jgi:hypothetical protein
MTEEKLFYKYQTLKSKKDCKCKYRKNECTCIDKENDCNCNYTNYTINNLANNQLFFNRPDKFNDPYDSRTYWCLKGTKEKHIKYLTSFYGLTYEEADSSIENSINTGYMTKDGDLICYDPLVEKDLDLHGHYLRDSLPKVCCFSGNDDNILMWSHYADSHKGICLRFRSKKDWEDLEFGKSYLEFDCRDLLFPLKLAGSNPLHSIFNKKKFLEVKYRGKDEICPIVNHLDINSEYEDIKCLLIKFKDWIYEDEYRIMITRYDVIQGLLSKEEFKKGLLKYRKEDLEGIVFGLKITYENAKLVYKTVKKNYIDEGFLINFYEAKEVSRKYIIDIGEPIKDIEKYINSLLNSTQL